MRVTVISSLMSFKLLTFATAPFISARKARSAVSLSGPPDDEVAIQGAAGAGSAEARARH